MQNEKPNPEPTQFPSYRPSVFYFRKLLHESASLERAVTVALVVLAELEQLKLWSAGKEILIDECIAAGAECMRQALRDTASHGQAIMLGLFLCHELEQLKALVRWHGLIPPKWIVMPEEAEEKGWGEPTGTGLDF